MKKAFSVAACIAALCVAAVSPAAAMTAQEKYDALVQAGIFDGRDMTGGVDNDQMTRQQAAAVVALLLRMDDSGDAPPSTNFSDADASQWAQGYIDAAVQAGIVEGMGDSVFDPSGDVTIEQLAAIMVQALGLEVDPDAVVDGASDWAAAYVAAAINAGLITEQSDYTSPAQRDTLVNASYDAYNNSAQNEQATEDAVQESAGGGSDPLTPLEPGGSEWLDFPYYSDGQMSPAAPPTANIYAVYEGRLHGTFSGSNVGVGGDLWTCFDLSNNSLEAEAFLDGGQLRGTGGWTRVDNINATLTGTMNDGTETPRAAVMDMRGAFWGPNAEEIGGEWKMNVTDIGEASGKFGASLTDSYPK